MGLRTWGNNRCELDRGAERAQDVREGWRKIQKGSEVSMRRSELFVLALALLLALVQAGLAQEVTGAITGKVIDPSGSAIAGANVSAKDVDRGTVWKSQTNESGIYNLPRLPIGRYEVRVEANGFQTAVHSAFDLALNQTATIRS